MAKACCLYTHRKKLRVISDISLLAPDFLVTIQFCICTSQINYAGLLIGLKEGRCDYNCKDAIVDPPHTHTPHTHTLFCIHFRRGLIPHLLLLKVIIIFITTQPSLICSAACSLKRSWLHGRGTADRVTQKERPLYLLPEIKNDAVQLGVYYSYWGEF